MPADLLTTEYKERIKAEILENCTLVADCWVYKGASSLEGYGMKKIGKRSYTVSRFMLAYDTRESLANPYEACHKDDICPYKACGNPEHLFWATKNENWGARERRKKEERQGFTFWQSNAWIDGVFYEDRPDPTIDPCLAGLNRGKIEHATTVFFEWDFRPEMRKVFCFLADIARDTRLRLLGHARAL